MGNPGWERRTRSFVYSFIHWVSSLTCLSWSDFIGTLHWLQKIFGRSMRLTQLTSRYEKVCDFHFHFETQSFFFMILYLGRYGYSSTCWLMDFDSACELTSCLDVLCVCLCWSLNSKVTVAFVVFVALWELIRRLFTWLCFELTPALPGGQSRMRKEDPLICLFIYSLG